jgi:hypothetical protein
MAQLMQTPMPRGCGSDVWGWPRRQAQSELALADRVYLVVLAGVEMDQARRGQRSLARARAHQQLAAQNEHERVLMDLVLVQSLTLGQQQRDHAIRVLVGAKDLRMVRRDTQTT